MLKPSQGKRLLKLARNAVQSFYSKKMLKYSREKKEFSQPQGIFVTLTLHGKLQGCIGFPYPTMPLAEAIVEASRSAAFHDPRFKALEEKEFKKCKIEISVLTKPEEILVKGQGIVNEIKIGKDGLIVALGGFSGLLLPQVALEYKWSSLEFLEATCSKAGLPKNAWLNPQCHIFKFQAQIFKEKGKKR